MGVFGRRLRCLAIRLTCTVLCWPDCFAAQQVVIYGDDDYAPYSYVEHGEFKGMYVDILRAAARQMLPDFQLDIQPIPWKRGLADLESGASFALFPPGRKKERYYIAPYSVPLYRETVVLFCTDRIMQRPHKTFPDDYAGLTIGTNLGFLLSERLMTAAQQHQVNLEPAKGNETNLKKLAAQHIDCYASDRTAARYSMKRLRAEFDPGFALNEAIELSGENTFIGYSSKNNPAYKDDFVARMNAVLLSMQASGLIRKIEDSYLR